MIEKSIFVAGGAGNVGMWAINYLARMPGVDKIIVADINQDMADRVINSIAVSSSIHGFYPKLEFKRVDLSDKDGTTKVLGETQPTVILNTSTMLANYVPAERRLIAEKKFPVTSRLAGHTIAKDLYLTMKLMEAVKASGVASKVVNVSFPDHTNCVLGKIGLAPTVGAGTIDLTANGIRVAVSRRLRVPVRNVSVTLIVHHSIRAMFAAEYVKKFPAYLKIRVGEEDVTEKFKKDEMLWEGAQNGGGKADANMLAASSGAQNAWAVLNNTGEIRHAPGIKGLPGGYPVRLADEVDLALPPEVSLRDALKINEEGMKYDGIERFEDDGTVVFTKETVRLMDELLGMKWTRMRVSEVDKMTQELISAYKRLA
ncbi:MAG TPA: hypothetical protein VJ574_03745 [Candidatus Bathyarchaeia archaeon]|nr:hypothetical protein [Candidatus Bathyarchaeia archaeon]